MLRTAVTAAFLVALSGLAANAAEKRIYRVDSVIAMAAPGMVSVQAKGAVQGGGWSHPRLKISHADAHTLVVEFLAQPPAPGAAVITGLLPVSAKVTIKAGRGTVAVRAMAEANEVTAQILH